MDGAVRRDGASKNGKKEGHHKVPFLISGIEEWADPLRFVSTFLSGDMCPKPEIPGVRLILFHVVLKLIERLDYAACHSMHAS